MANSRQSALRQDLQRLVTNLYLMFVFPFALIITVVSLFFVSALVAQGAWSALSFYALCWVAAVVPAVKWVSKLVARRRVLREVIAYLRSPTYFDPVQDLECYHEGEGAYLGIDAARGTILSVRYAQKGQVNIVALTMNDWTSRELDGSRLRLCTNKVDQPFVEICLPSIDVAERWYATLGAMESGNFGGSYAFPAYVADRCASRDRLSAGNVLHAV